MLKFFEVLGIIGALIVSVSNLPQLFLFFKQGHARGISHSGNIVGFIGVGLRTIYLAHATHFDLIALGPYFFALMCIGVTEFYIRWPRKE